MTNELIEKIEYSKRVLFDNFNTEFTVMFSGGRDSCVLKHLITSTGLKATYYFCMSGLNHDMVLNFIKTYHADTVFVKPQIDIRDQIFTNNCVPTIKNKFCCATVEKSYKSFHDTTKYHVIVTGQRQQSNGSKPNIENLTHVTTRDNDVPVLAPLRDWTLNDVKEYVYIHNIHLQPSYELYGKSLGCAFCPRQSATTRKLMTKHHPEVTERMKNICRALYARNDSLRNAHHTFDDFWHWVYTCTNYHF